MKILNRISLLLLAVALFASCSDDENDPQVLGIKSMAILNAGEDQQTRVEGVLNGTTFDFEVSPLSDLTALELEIVPNAGTTTTPASDSVIDFEANNGEQNVIATLGTETMAYKAKVTVSEFADELAIKSLTVSGVSFPEVEISHAAKTIELTFANVTGTTAVLSGFDINPASATIKEANPAIEEDGEGNPFMTIDFSVAGEKYITIQNGAKEAKYVITAIINEAGFDAGSATLVHDQILGSGLDAAILGKNTTRGAYFDGRYVFYACREGGNNIYYYDITDQTNERKALNMGTDIVTGGTWAISDVRVTDNGNIYVCNMVMAKDQVLKVYRWDGVADDTPEKVLEYTITDPVAPATAVRLGDAMSVIGDPKTNGEILLSNFPFNNAQQGQFYSFKFESGTLATGAPQVIDLVGKYTAPSTTDKSLGQYARVSQVPGTGHYLVTGSATGIQVYSSTWESLVQVERDTPIQGRAMDAHLFEYNGIRYLAYTVNREWAANDAFIEIVALTEGNDFVEGLQGIKEKSMEDIRAYKKQITTNATKGAVWVATSSSMKVVNDKVYVFGFVCEYGGAVYEFTK